MQIFYLSKMFSIFLPSLNHFASYSFFFKGLIRIGKIIYCLCHCGVDVIFDQSECQMLGIFFVNRRREKQFQGVLDRLT